VFAQIAYAVCLQRPGGCFVLKIFDIFTKYTVDMLALLASMYETVYVTKPNTSRIANSEKYVVCRNFLLSKNEVFPFIYQRFLRMTTQTCVPWSILPDAVIPGMFINKIQEINAIMGQQQIENIHFTLQLIHETSRGSSSRDVEGRSHVIQTLIKKNVQKCVQWCLKHRVPVDGGT
jgi:cap1 methyltransferase